MKLAALVSFGGALVILTACNFEPQALLGKDPSDKDSVRVNDSKICEEKRMIRMSTGSHPELHSPSDLEATLVSVEKSTTFQQVHFTFRKLADGNFPAVVSVQYKKLTGTSVGRVLKCKQANFGEDPAQYRSYACVVPRNFGETDWDEHGLDYLELKNEKCKDASCTAKASFVAGFTDGSCRAKEGRKYNVRINNSVVPNLTPTAIDPWASR